MKALQEFIENCKFNNCIVQKYISYLPVERLNEHIDDI